MFHASNEDHHNYMRRPRFDTAQLSLVRTPFDDPDFLFELKQKSGLSDVICGKYVGGRGIDLLNEVVRRNLEGVVAKRKTGTYATVSGWQPGQTGRFLVVCEFE